MLFLVIQRFINNVGNQFGFVGHHFRKAFGVFNVLRNLLTEIFNQIGEERKVFFLRRNLIAHNIPERNLRGKFAIPVEFEIQVIGNDKVRKRISVAVELWLVLFMVDAQFQVFGFNKTYRNIFLRNNIIGRTTGLALRLVDNRKLFPKDFLQI